ncbi:MAG: hypothetical protein ABR575_02390 [Actinomycetota bacterium]
MATIPADGAPPGSVHAPDRLSRALGHAAAFAATTVLLVAVFGGTFLLHPDRSAPTRDPAYYTWRTRALLTEQPETLLQIEGPFGLFSGGYRVAAPVLTGVVGRVADIDVRSAIAVIMVVVPVLTALLLAGFAYRARPDPLLWHAVALGAGGMMLTPPFVGYLDNLLGVFFLAGALWFLGPARRSWAGRAGLFAFLTVAGITHTTTLAIFGLMLGGIALARLVVAPSPAGEHDLGARVRRVVMADGPMLAVALAAAIVTYLVWTFGIWGEPAPLSESALVFPYQKSFFYARLEQWVAAMRPVLNGPLLAAGLVGLLAAGRRWAEDDLARIAVVWLGPLLGIFGFLAGLRYPYFRFFNTTLAWVLLVGLGAYFALRLFIDLGRRGGPHRLALVGVAAIAVVLVTNLSTGLAASGWSDPDRGWLTNRKRADLGLLNANLAAVDERDRPVVFVSDARPPEIETLAQVWGITQLNGNTARHGLPDGQVDRGHVYQGALASFLNDEPTVTGNRAYDDLSEASLDEIYETGGDDDPLVVVAAVFNEVGPNAPIASGESPAPDADGIDVWALHDGRIDVLAGDAQPPYPSAADAPGAPPDPGLANLVRAALGLLAVALPGILAASWFLFGARVVDVLAIGPALSACLVVASATVVLAVARSPLSAGRAWIALGLTAAGGTAAFVAVRRAGPSTAASG